MSSIYVENVPNVVWQGSNDIYCCLEFLGASSRTTTVANCKATAKWDQLFFEIPLGSLSNEVEIYSTLKSEPLKITIMHENLVVADKAIGTAETSLVSVFPDLLSSRPSVAAMTGAAATHTVTAYEGSRFKRKVKGTITFTAEIIHMEAQAVTERTNRTTGLSQPTPREKMEFRMDSGSVSLASRSIDPYAFREGSVTLDDYSAAQLRNAADLLQDWESPTPPVTKSTAAFIPPPRLAATAPTPAPVVKGSVPARIASSTTLNVTADRAEAAKKPPAPTARKSGIATPNATGTSASLPTAPAKARASIAEMKSKDRISAAPLPRPTLPSLQQQQQHQEQEQEQEQHPPTTANKSAAATYTASAAAAASASTSASAAASTRLRDRRTPATSTEAVAVNVPHAASTLGNTKARRLSATEKVSGGTTRAKPNTDVVSVGHAQQDKTGSPSKLAFGHQAIDEAVQLSMRKKGGFLKLTGAEFVLLLDTLMFPVRPELLDGAVGRLSNIATEGIDSPVPADKQPAKQRAYPGAQLEDVSLPIVHAMSLAATISFAIRDGNLLSGGGESGSSGLPPTGRAFTPQDSAGLVTMSQGQSERALDQLQGLVLGPYTAIKACILQLCGGVGPPASETHGVIGGRAVSPAMSQLTGTTTAVATSALTRPSQWSPADVARFLLVLHVTVEDNQRGAVALDGSALLSLDASGLRSRFSGNPSIDRTRLIVYVLALKYLDEWWDRGIRPADTMAGKYLDQDIPGGGSSKGKGKRRGSKSSTGTSAWGELETVWKAAAAQMRGDGARDSGGNKVVDGGRVLQSHLLKIADFQPLLEAMTPLNRAFAWSCSLESLIRFASIIGGMRGYAWIKPSSVYPGEIDEDDEDGARSASHLSHAHSQFSSSVEEKQSHSSWAERADEGNAVAMWVVLQKSSANSTTELTQLVRLCNELKVVMKYAAREDDFLAYIPVSCLRVTSVAEIKAKRFEAELQGLLLEDLAVGKHVVVAGPDALHRLCERFDWWDRPTPAVLEKMSGHVGEVVSLAEAADKRRVGVRLLQSGLCDALPLEGLRLCSAEELELVRSKLVRPSLSAAAVEALEVGASGDEDRVVGKSGRRKSKINPESRKTRLRSLIRNLNNPPEDSPIERVTSRPTSTNATAKPPRAPMLPAATKQPAPTFAPPQPYELDNKSELSNLSAELEEEEEDPALRTSTTQQKKQKSFTSKLYSASPLAAPVPLPVPVAGSAKKSTVAPATKPVVPISAAAMMSPPKRIVKRTMVRSPQPVAATVATEAYSDSPFSPSRPNRGDESGPPPAESSNVAHNKGFQKHSHGDRDREQEDDDESSGRLYVSTDGPANYSWLRGPQRSPLVFPLDVPEVAPPRPETGGLGAVAAASAAVGPTTGEGTGKKPAPPASLHILQPAFDAAHAEYTEGVLKYAIPPKDFDDDILSPTEDGQQQHHHLHHAGGAFQPKFVRHNRPQSAPSTGRKATGKSNRGNTGAAMSPPHNRDEEEALGIEGNNAHMAAQSSFGLSGVGYTVGGGLQAHPNLWVNEHIPAVAEADVPRKVPHKQPLHKTEHRHNTQKLFEYHERHLTHNSAGGDPSNEGADRFFKGDFMLGATIPAKESNPKKEAKTVQIPQRPRSANPTSRGISKPVAAGSNRPVSSGAGVMMPAEAEMLVKLDEDTRGGPAGAGDPDTLNIAGGAPPIGVAKAGAAYSGKRTREEELKHIAAARSAKEVALKEKVLMKELKRLQGREKVVI